ncbi:MAG: metal-dependent transcriptional regulator [Actinobacteria bacterium]|nr:metal-dependent transcriptional regulator [Actinomycetota bacterium]
MADEAALSDAIQDYLKEIYKLRTDGGKVTTTALARRLRVSPASVSAMVKKLAALGLAEHVPYRGVDLTPAGERVALEVVRHHRLLELYLAETLGIAVESVHAEADRLEHVLSDELEARIDSALGYPTHDPHGDPIPDAQLQMQAEREVRPLSALGAGEEATVLRVPDDDELLPKLSSLGLVPGRTIVVKKLRPFTIAIEGVDRVVPRKLADAVGVG